MFLALLERYNHAYQRNWLPFACMMAQARNLAPFISHDRVYQPADFMPKPEPPKRGPTRPARLGREVYEAFLEGAIPG